MATLFLTGGSSSLGRRVLHHLGNHFKIIATSRTRRIDVPGVEIELLPGGLEDCPKFAAQIASADVILHLAAITHSDDREAYFRINTELTRQLVSLGRPGQRFVYISTQCADPAGGAYGHSKWLAENAVRESGLDFAIIRPAEIFGSKASEGIDALVAMARRTHLLVDFRYQGSVRYSPVALDDVAEFIAKAVLSPVGDRRTYTLCADQPCTAVEMAVVLKKRISPLFAIPVPVRLLEIAASLKLPMPFKPDQIKRLIMAKSYDNSEARADYGFKPSSFLEYLTALPDHAGNSSMAAASST